MGCFRCLAFASSLLFLQVFTAGLCEDDLPCLPGFTTDHFVFKVHRTQLHIGQRLGKVSVDDCTGRQRAVFKSDDSRFHVEFDGTVRLKRVVNLHDGHKSFSVHAWVSNGMKVTARVTVQHDPRGRHHHVARVGLEQLETPPSLPVIQFPHSSGGLVRRKREWLIPPTRMSENVRGPFPLKVVEIKSSLSKEFTVEYAISGPGADQPPVGLFTVGKSSGVLFVNQPLDREKQSTYTLQAVCKATEGNVRENPIEIIIEVLDQNDNKPIFTQDSFMGFVPEAAKEGFEIVTVSATDADDPNMDNSVVWYSILSQDPLVPNGRMFEINYLTGVIRLTGTGLDKEKNPEYTLVVQAADNAGQGTQVTCKVFIKVTDSNDNPPQFTKSLYTASVPENVVGYEVVKMQVTDDDDPHTPAWFTKFRIIQGNVGGFFNVSTGPSKLEGIITTVKALDFEISRKYTLLVVVENDAPFDIPVLTSTATVEVTVKDVNEAPIFNPVVKVIEIEENLALGEALTTYTATDPDTDQKQTVWYRMGSDPAGWLNIQRDSGLVSVKSQMDRESPFVLDGKYKALILAIDNDTVPATGTGTLLIELTDVNDNAPTIDQRVINVCNEDPQPVLLSITDPDGPGFNAPFRVELRDQSQKNWTARMNASKTGIELLLKTKLPQGDYGVVLRVFDALSNAQESTLHAKVCDCKGDDFQCNDRSAAGLELPGILGILAAIMLLLLLVLLLLMFLRRRTKVKKDPLLPEDDVRDNIYYYDEEGGGEEDQDYDLSQLHRGLDNRPDVFRNDVAPTFMPAPQYRPRPANPEDIGNFIDDNLKAADNDPTAPPYDSLLVFDYEGGGSEAGSLSSLNSSSSGGDQDYDCLNEWGPRFKKLADMYGGGED